MEASAWHIKNQVEDSQEVVEHQLISPFLLAYHEEILREKFSFIRIKAFQFTVLSTSSENPGEKEKISP